ncbi:cupin domain-containing protein [Magnetofaba australis]|nr:cupin domain-containing protein [Magnetofaba australis]
MSAIDRFQWASEAEAVADLQRRGYAPSRYDYPPGCHFAEHTHPYEKIVVALSGRFALTLGGETLILESLQGVRVPAGARHAAWTVGEQTVRSLDAAKL